MSNQYSFFEIPLKKDNEIFANQRIYVGNNNAFYFQQQGEKNSIMGIDTYNHKMIFEYDERFSSIATNENVKNGVIEIDIENLKVEYNQDITFIAEENGRKFTYKITPYAVQRKDKDSKEFQNVCQFNQPLNIFLPNNLPNQLTEGLLEMNEFPSQMFNVFQENYSYSAFTSKNSNLKILKSPNDEILISKGSKLIKAEGFEYFKDGNKSVVGVRTQSSKGIVQENSTQGVGFYVSEDELKQVAEFVEGKVLPEDQFQDKNNPDPRDIDYKKTRNIKEASKTVDDIDNQDKFFPIETNQIENLDTNIEYVNSSQGDLNSNSGSDNNSSTNNIIEENYHQNKNDDNDDNNINNEMPNYINDDNIDNNNQHNLANDSINNDDNKTNNINSDN